MRVRLAALTGIIAIALGCGLSLSPGAVEAAKALPRNLQIAKERARTQALLKERLAPSLRELPALLEKRGKGGNLKAKGIEVRDGYVRVAVRLTKPSQSVVTRVKQLGFIPAGGTQGATLTGKVPVAKLKEIALTNGVKHVDPAR